MTDVPAPLEGLGLCPQCVEGFELPGQPRGSIEQIGPFSTYIATPKTLKDPKAVVLYFYDIFGFCLKNNKLLPDRLADALGVAVLVPDLLPHAMSESVGDKVPSSAEEARKQTLWSKLGMVASFASYIPFIYANRPTTKYAQVEEYLSVLRTTYDRIGGVGYCYGGCFVLEYGKARPDKPGVQLDAVVACHPSMYNIDMVNALTSPTSFAMCEEDPQTPPKLLETVKNTLAEKSKSGFQSQLHVFPGTMHGNFARPNLAVPEVRWHCPIGSCCRRELGIL